MVWDCGSGMGKEMVEEITVCGMHGWGVNGQYALDNVKDSKCMSKVGLRWAAVDSVMLVYDFAR